MIVRIPVSPFSRKLIQLRYQSDPIKLRRDDILHMIINSDRIKSTKRASETLTASVDIDLPARIDTSRSHLLRVGYQIYLYHIDQMVSFLDGVDFDGGAPYAAIRQYCQSHKIDPDDIDFDSLYKNYQRKSAKYCTNTDKNVLKNCNICQGANIDLNDIVAEICQQLIHELYDSRGRFRTWLYRNIYIYMDMLLNNLTYDESCRKYKLAKRTIYYISERVPEFLDENDVKIPEHIHIV